MKDRGVTGGNPEALGDLRHRGDNPPPWAAVEKRAVGTEGKRLRALKSALGMDGRNPNLQLRG